MNKYQVLMNKAQDCYDASIRCFKNKSITMAWFWKLKSDELKNIAANILISQLN